MSETATISEPQTDVEATSTETDGAVPEAVTEAFNNVFGHTQPEEKPAQPKDASATLKHQQVLDEEAQELAMQAKARDAEAEGDEGEEGEDVETQPQDTVPEDEEAPQDAEDGQGPEETTLDPILRDAAKRAGRTDESIDELLKYSPELAEEIFRGDLAQQAGIGKKMSELGALQAQAPVGSEPNVSQEPPKNALEQVYGPKLGDLREKYGDEMIDELMTPLLEPLQQMTSYVEQQYAQSMAQQFNTWVESQSDTYGELLGKGTNISEAQREARQKLAEMADAIRSGFSSRGQELSVQDALEQAKVIVAHEHIAEMERKRLTDSLKRRSNQVTERPSQRKQKTPVTPSSGLDAVFEKLQSLHGSGSM